MVIDRLLQLRRKILEHDFPILAQALDDLLDLVPGIGMRRCFMLHTDKGDVRVADLASIDGHVLRSRHGGVASMIVLQHSSRHSLAALVCSDGSCKYCKNRAQTEYKAQAGRVPLVNEDLTLHPRRLSRRDRGRRSEHGEARAGALWYRQPRVVYFRRIVLPGNRPG